MVGGDMVGGQMVEVAPAPASDPACQRLLAEYLAELTARMPEEFDVTRASPPAPGDFDPPGGVFLLARIDGEPVGIGALRTTEPGVGEIRRMYVAPAARGRGVGLRILAALEDVARARGHHTLRLDTAEELSEAQSLYERSGYRRIPAYNDNEFAQRWYEKQLE
jgi:GNAT superfamily N-acetyltransferase